MNEYTLVGYSGSYEPGESMSDRLWAAVNTYWNEYLDFHGLQNPHVTPDLPANSRAANQSLSELGEAFRECIRTLTFDKRVVELTRSFFEGMDLDVDLSGADFKGYAKVNTRFPVARDSLRVALGFEVAEVLVASAEARIETLVDLVADRDLSHGARAYLDRATRLYLWGHDPECVIMCRSVLEAALAHRLYGEYDPDDETPPLHRLVNEAKEKGLLGSWHRRPTRRGWAPKHGSPLWRAERLRASANGLLHGLPVLGVAEVTLTSAEEALHDLSAVLSELFPLD